MSNHIVRASKPIWIRRLTAVVVVPLRCSAAPEQHPDYFPVLTALNAQRVRGQIVSITSYKPVCDEWHEVHAVELGYYWYERRTAFVLVRIGGSE